MWFLNYVLPTFLAAASLAVSEGLVVNNESYSLNTIYSVEERGETLGEAGTRVVLVTFNDKDDQPTYNCLVRWMNTGDPPKGRVRA